MGEPFGALDAMTRETLNMELQRVRMTGGKTIRLITHSIPEAVFHGDRVLVMTPRPGRIVDDLAVDLPRPRTLAMQTKAAFGSKVMEVPRYFNTEGRGD